MAGPGGFRAFSETFDSHTESAYTARLLNLLLRCTLVWFLINLAILTPLFAVRKLESAILAVAGVAMVSSCQILLRRGFVRQAVLIYLWLSWIGNIVCTLVSGGIRSPYLALQIILTLGAALLLGRRAGRIGLCISGALLFVLALSDYLGYPAPEYFPMPAPFTFSVLILVLLLTYLAVNHTEGYARQEAMRLSEERLRLALYGGNTAAFLWDVRNDEIFFSPRFFHILGIHQDEVQQAQSLAFFPVVEAQFAGWKRDALQFTSTHRTHCEQDLPLQNAAGESIWIRISAVATDLTCDGQPLRIAGTVTDVTHQKEAELEMARARDLAHEAASTKSRFLANMSHEIRTPVSSIIGLSVMLRDHPLSPEASEIASLIESSGEGLLQLVNDILDLSRIEAGKLPVHPEPTDLTAHCRQVVEMLRPLASRKSLDLALSLHHPPPPTVLIDAKRLRQILLNLLNNAIKFTDAGEIRLHLGWIPGSAGDGIAEFRVTDTGIGIPSGHLHNIFDPFVQVTSTPDRAFSGAGLGLSICRRIVQCLGGQIGVRSIQGEGSTFWFTLPSEVIQQATPPLRPVDNSRPQYPNLTVLLVDDNRINRFVAIRLLSKFGIAADAADCADSAVELSTCKRYDLILMDVQMPGKDGLQATREIRAVGRGSPIVVALTAHVLPEDHAQCMAAGMNHFLSKPLTIDTLGNLLASCNPASASAQSA